LPIEIVRRLDRYRPQKADRECQKSERHHFLPRA
jgi:hypothetical protein